MPQGTMKDGVCPACGSREVHSAAGTRLPRNRYSSLVVSGLRTVLLDDYVCVRCGNVQRFLSRPEDLQRIAEKWPRVRGRTS